MFEKKVLVFSYLTPSPFGQSPSPFLERGTADAEQDRLPLSACGEGDGGYSPAQPGGGKTKTDEHKP